MEIITQIKDRVGIITINREKSYNSLSLQCIREITQTLMDWENDSAVKVIIITGAGSKAFVSGADISEFTKLTAQEALAFSQNGQNFLRKIEDYSKPIIAAINGYALGGGLELALACHIRVAAANAQMGLPEVKLGIIPGYGGTQRLTRAIGKSRALHYALTGESMNAQTALSFGLISEIHPVENILTAALRIAMILTKMPRESMSGIIASCNASTDNTTGYDVEARCFEKCVKHSDFTEGVRAFLDKRAATFE